jgi:hypothetical protein
MPGRGRPSSVALVPSSFRSRRSRRGVLRLALVLAGVVGLGLTACSSSSSGSSSTGTGGAGGECPNDLPASCPTPIPSYKDEIAKIFADDCVVCHSPAGTGANNPLVTYAQVQVLESANLDQVYACRMPPAGYAFTLADREALLAWLVCGSPDN